MASARRRASAAASVPTIALRWRPSSPPPGGAGGRGAARSSVRSTPGCTARRSSSSLLPLLLLLATVTKPVALPAPTLPPRVRRRRGRGARARARDASTRTARPGARARSAAATWFRQKMAVYDLPTRKAAWQESIPGLGKRRLQNVMAVVKGSSPDVIVVMAHRDDTGAGPGANDNASGTAALLELARTYARPQSETQTARPADAHARLPLDRRRRVRRPRRAALRPTRRRGAATSSRCSTSTRSPGRGRRASSSRATGRARRRSTLSQTASRRIAEQSGQHVRASGRRRRS